MADKYFRVITVIVNVCPLPLRALLMDLARKDSNKNGVIFTDIDSYLKQQSKKVLGNSRLSRDQLNLLYPTPPGKATVDDLDVTLLSVLLKALFGKTLGSSIISCIKKITNIRNELQHRASTLDIPDTEFQRMWKDITTETANIANIVGGPKYEKEIKIEITKAEISFMSTLGGVLLKWYNSVLLETKVNTDHIKEDTQQIRTLLEGASVKRMRRSGSELGQIRAVNQIQETLIRNFDITMKAYIDPNFTPPDRPVSKIKKYLSSRNFVIVSGYGNSKYLQTALLAVQSLELGANGSGCAELNQPEDLFCINGDEVHLLLLRKSFLSSLSTKENDFILYTLNRLEYHISFGENPLKVIMLADKKVLEEFKEMHQHNLLTTVINIDTATSEHEPEDLTRRETHELSGVARNLIAWSGLFIQEHAMTFHDDDFLKKAEEKFLMHNCVFCVSESSCARSALAIHLSKLNPSEHCIVLTDPDDLKYVELGQISSLMILDFAGKFRYDETKVHKWLEKFDFLYDAVTNRVISVIMTCQESRLRRCRDEAASHIVLEQTINIPKEITMTTKKNGELKPSTQGGSLQSDTHRNEADRPLTSSYDTIVIEETNDSDTAFSKENCTNGHTEVDSQESEDDMEIGSTAKVVRPTTDFEFLEVEVKHHDITDKENGDDRDSCVWGMCQLPDRSFVLLDYYKQKMKLYDSKFVFRKHYSVIGSAKSICCTGPFEITIAFEKALRIYDMKSGKWESIQTHITPDMLASTRQTLFAMDKTNKVIHAYSLKPFQFIEEVHVPVVEMYSPTFCNSLTVSKTGERFYIVYLQTIKCFNKQGVVLATYEMPLQSDSRKSSRKIETTICRAGDDILLYMVQENSEGTEERFVFLDPSLTEIQKGKFESKTSITSPSAMCFDKETRRAIIGHRKGPFVTDIHFSE